MALLSINELNKHFGGLHAVNDVTFDVHEGTIQAVIGPNGAGKTTLFNLISGSLQSDSGTVIFKKSHIENSEPHEIAQLGISRTFQNIKIFDHMTILENVMVGRHVKSNSGFFKALFNVPSTWKEEKEILEKSMKMLELMGIDELAHEDASSLAFGQQRSVELARALNSDPELLLLDEPAAGLNIYETAELAKMIQKIRNMGITILLIEHDMSLVMDISDDIVVLGSGAMITQGLPENVQKNEDVIRIYLGDEDA